MLSFLHQPSSSLFDGEDRIECCWAVSALPTIGFTSILNISRFFSSRRKDHAQLQGVIASSFFSGMIADGDTLLRRQNVLFHECFLGCQENARPMQHQFFFTGSSITENVGGEIVLCVVLEVLRRFCNSRYPFDDGRTIRDFRIN